MKCDVKIYESDRNSHHQSSTCAMLAGALEFVYKWKKHKDCFAIYTFSSFRIFILEKKNYYKIPLLYCVRMAYKLVINNLFK